MIEYGIYNNVAGQPYDDFIEYAISKSDAILLVDFRYNGKANRQYPLKSSAKKMLASLRPYCIKRRGDKDGKWEWPNNTSLIDKYSQKPASYNMTIKVYRLSEELYEILREPGSFFAWKYPKYPADLSFFKDNKCWFAITGHEKFACFYTESKEEVEFLKSMGIPFEKSGEVADDYIFVEDYELK